MVDRLIDEAFKELGVAIVRTACEDYLKARRAMDECWMPDRRYQKEHAKKDGNMLVATRPAWYLKWFRSKWYATICRINPELLIKGLDMRYAEWKKGGFKGNALMTLDIAYINVNDIYDYGSGVYSVKHSHKKYCYRRT